MARKATLPKGIFRRGDSLWLRYTVGGKQIKEPAGTEDIKQAEGRLAAIKTSIFEGRYIPQKKKNDVTLGVLRTEWLETGKKKKTHREMTTRSGRVVDMLGENTLINTLTHSDMRKLRDRLKDTISDRTDRVLSPATVNRHMETLTSAFNFATKEGYLHQNPMVGFESEKEKNFRNRICSPEEYATLIAKSTNDNLTLAIHIAYWTGMRLGEVCDMTWDRVDLKARVLVLRDVDTKTKEARRVPIADELHRVLSGIKIRHIKGRLIHQRADSTSKAFRNLAKKLGFADLTFHNHRHGIVTRLIREGVDLVTISTITGHKDINMLKRYNEVSDSAKIKAINVLKR